MLNEFSSLIKKNRIVIDKDSENFREVVTRLIGQRTSQAVTANELSNLRQFTGLLKHQAGTELIVKNEIIGSEIYMLNDIDLDFNSVIEKILGVETYRTIIDRINNGIQTLNGSG